MPLCCYRCNRRCDSPSCASFEPRLLALSKVLSSHSTSVHPRRSHLSSRARRRSDFCRQIRWCCGSLQGYQMVAMIILVESILRGRGGPITFHLEPGKRARVLEGGLGETTRLPCQRSLPSPWIDARRPVPPETTQRVDAAMGSKGSTGPGILGGQCLCFVLCAQV